MHLTLWLILLMTLGGAYLLTQWKTRRWHVELQAPMTYGQVRLPLPENWNVEHVGSDGDDVILAKESASPQRRLLVSTFLNEHAKTPVDYLLYSGVLPMEILQTPDLQRESEELNIPNGEGILIHVARTRSSLRGIRSVHYESIACVIYDDGRGILMQLSNPTSSSPEDDALLYEIARKLTLADPPTPQPVTDPSDALSI